MKRNIILLIIHLLVISYLHSQNLLWEKTIFLDTIGKLSAAETIREGVYITVVNFKATVSEDSNGNILISISAILKPESGDSLPKVVVFKCDSLGNVFWHYVFNKNRPIYPNSFYQDKIGDYFFIGVYPLYLYQNRSWVYYAPYVAKFKPYESNPFFENITNSNDTIINYFPIYYLTVSGFFSDNYDNILGFSNSVNFYSSNFLKLLFFDKDGNFKSLLNIDTLKTSDSLFYFDQAKLIQTTDGDYLICGNFGKRGINRYGKMFLYKLNRQGNKVWQKFFGESRHLVDFQVSEKNIFVISKVEASQTPYLLSKFNLEDTSIYTNVRINLDNKYYLTSNLLTTIDGGFIVCGTTYYKDFTIPHLIKFNQTGEIEFDYILPNDSTNMYWIRSIYKSSDGNYLICGSKDDSLYIAKVNIIPVSLVNWSDSDKEPFEIFPFPVIKHTSLNIKFRLVSIEKVEFELFDSYGSLLQKITPENLGIGDNYANIQISNLSSGIYWVKMSKCGNIIGAKPIIVLR